MTTFPTHHTTNHKAADPSDMGWPAHWKLDPPTEEPERPRAGEPTTRTAEGTAEPRGPGRPSGKTPEKVHAVCTFIRMTGLADTAAAALAGVTRSTLARWKKEDEEVEMQLETARAQYQMPRLEKIGETRMKDGQLDWRAQAWLVKFANPQVHGAPSRRRRLQDVELEPAAPERSLTPEEEAAREAAEMEASLQEAVEGWAKFNRNPAQGVITPVMLSLLQQRRAIAIREMNVPPAAADGETAGASLGHGKDGVSKGGTPGAGEAGTSSGDEARAPSPPAGAEKNVTIRPEIHGLYMDEETWRARVASMPWPRTADAMAG